MRTALSFTRSMVGALIAATPAGFLSYSASVGRLRANLAAPRGSSEEARHRGPGGTAGVRVACGAAIASLAVLGLATAADAGAYDGSLAAVPQGAPLASEGIALDPGISSTEPGVRPTAAVSAPVTAARSVLVILVDWGSRAPSGGVTYAPAAPQDSVTTAQAETQVGTKDTQWYGLVSYGQFAGWNATATGWFTIATPPLDSGNQCVNAFRATIQTEGNEAAETAGYTPANYDTVMYYFSGAPCGWGGWENGANPSHIWINGTMGTTGATVHELGHTLGLGHGHSYPCNGDTVTLSSSCAVEEYGDPYDVMGAAFNGGPGSAGSFTAMQLSYLGWMSGREKTATVGTYKIAPIEQQKSALQAVKVVDGSQTFWVEYRRTLGVDAWLSNYPQLGSGVRILREAPDSAGFPAPGTYLLDMTPDGGFNFYDAALAVGSTFVNPLGNVAIKLISATASVATIQIIGKQTITTYNGPTGAEYHDAFTASAILTDKKGKALSGYPVTFTLGSNPGESCTASTNISGEAQCPLMPSQAPGSGYTIKAEFAGNAKYAASSDAKPFTINREEATVKYTGDVTSHYHDVFTASANVLEDSGPTPAVGTLVTFQLGATDTCSAITDSSGNASCSIKPTQAGSLSITATAESPYEGSVTAAFSATPEETTMSYTGPTVILAGASGATLTAQMVEDGSNDNDGDSGSPGPVPSQTVTLALGTQSCTGGTDASGNVSCTISKVTVPLGPQTVSATFAGNAEYAPSSASQTATVFSFPSTGVFALGDQTVSQAGPTTQVTWWGSSWFWLNSLSGGPAPFAFKGFISSITLPQTTPPVGCGSSWTTADDAIPPSVVPEYMGVVVTSAVTKTETGVAGNAVKIVVVKTNPGYGPKPTKPGTGTIVAAYC